MYTYFNTYNTPPVGKIQFLINHTETETTFLFEYTPLPVPYSNTGTAVYSDYSTKCTAESTVHTHKTHYTLTSMAPLQTLLLQVDHVLFHRVPSYWLAQKVDQFCPVFLS
mgnify:CR=1 FL=1